MLVTDFCRLILEIREQKVSRSEISRKYPWHRNTLLAYETDRLPDVDYLYTLSVETGYDFKNLVKLRLEAGILNDLFDFTDIDLFSNPPINPGFIEFVVNDESMTKTILPGATLYVDKNNKHLIEGNIYLFVINDQIKPCRVQFGIDKSLILNFDNKDYSPIVVTDTQLKNIEVKGKVMSVLNLF